MKLDKCACAKAIGILMLSWLAFPILYHMFKKKEVKNGKEKPRKEDNETLK